MRTRLSLVFAVLGLVVASCNPQGGEATTTQAPETTTTISAPEAMQLSYSLESGTRLEYEVDMDQTIKMSATGDPSAFGDEDVPAEMDLRITGTTVMTHEVSDGPEPGTFSIRIQGDFSDLEFSGTVDGEPVDSAEIPDMADMEPIDVTIVVDEQGNLIPDSDAPTDDLFGGLGSFDALQQLGPGSAGGQFVGPPLPEEEVTVGDTWSETIETPLLPGSDPITTTIDSEVVGTDTVDGAEVVVIETTTSTSVIEFDLGELLLGFMFAFIPEDATDEDRAEMEALAGELRFVMRVDDSVGEMTSWFDPESGLSRRAEMSSSVNMSFDINVPDESTGELVAFTMDMDVSQEMTFRLTSADGA